MTKQIVPARGRRRRRRENGRPGQHDQDADTNAQRPKSPLRPDACYCDAHAHEIHARDECPLPQNLPCRKKNTGHNWRYTRHRVYACRRELCKRNYQESQGFERSRESIDVSNVLRNFVHSCTERKFWAAARREVCRRQEPLAESRTVRRNTPLASSNDRTRPSNVTCGLPHQTTATPPRSQSDDRSVRPASGPMDSSRVSAWISDVVRFAVAPSAMVLDVTFRHGPPPCRRISHNVSRTGLRVGNAAILTRTAVSVCQDTVGAAASRQPRDLGSSHFRQHPGGRGDMTTSHRLRHVEMTPQRIGSGVVKDGFLVDAAAEPEHCAAS